MKKKKKTKQDDSKTADTTPDRSEELCRDADILDDLEEVYKYIEKGFDDQNERANDIQDFWDIYNCKLGSKQFYNGNSQIFVPIVKDAVRARRTRYANQLFPRSERYVECTSEDGSQPFSLMALLEHYVKKCKLQTNIVKPLLVNGDVEGHYHLYVGWRNTERHVAWRTKKQVEVEPGLEDPDNDVDTIEEETLSHGTPLVEVLSDSDVLVLPQTVTNAEEAIAEGGSLTILRRWKKDVIKRMITEGELDEENGNKLLGEMKSEAIGRSPKIDHDKKMVNAAGIQKDGRGKFCLIYENWKNLEVDGEMRLCRSFMAGSTSGKVISVRRNPYWSDKLPYLGCPVEKIDGVYKGRSLVTDVETIQYTANDAINEGMDSAAYALLPIIATDPEKNPRVGSMILSLAAVWETNPNDTKFMSFPQIWKDAFEIVANCRSQIQTTLAVNPAQITQQQSAKKKPSQAEIANEQAIDILTTSDAVSVLEEGILTPLLERMIELDHQFRDEEVTVRQYGDLGIRAQMEKIEPIQFDRRYQFRWFGVEAARNAQQIQQQIAALNIIQNIPPAKYPGYVLDLSPAIVQLVENAFGPRLAPLVFKDMKSQLSQNPELENDLMSEGMEMPVHAFDDHQKHMQVHSKKLQEMGDRTGQIRVHLMKHQMAMAQMANMQAQQQMGPGGGGPKPGAQPAQGRPAQGPPGMIPQDSLAGQGPQGPRRMG